MVGPAGRVVGVDLSEPAVMRARSVAAVLGLGNVEVGDGDIHQLDPAAIGGPFDLASAQAAGLSFTSRFAARRPPFFLDL
jgi:Methyltransferase domain